MLAFAACVALVSCDTASNGDDAGDVAISASLISTTANSIDVQVNRGDYSGNYFVGIAAAAEHNGTDRELAETILIKAIADGKVAEFSSADNKYIFNTGGAITVGEGWDLEAETDYCVVVFGVDAMGNIITDVVVVDATTAEADNSTSGVISATLGEVTAANIVVNVDKGDYTGNYYIGLLPAEYYEEYCGGTHEGIVTYMIEFEKYYETDFSKVDEVYIHYLSGEKNLSDAWMIDEDTDYFISVFGVDGSGNVTTNAVIIETKTPVVEKVGTIALEVIDASTEGVTVRATPTEGVGNYTFGAYTEAEMKEINYDWNYAAKYTKSVYEYNGLPLTGEANGGYLFNGAADMVITNVWTLEPNTDYHVVVFGVNDNEEINTDVAHETFYTGRSSGVAPKPASTAKKSMVSPLRTSLKFDMACPILK